MSNAAPKFPTAQEIWSALQDIAKQMRHATTSNQRKLLVEQSRLRNAYARLPEPRLIMTADLVARTPKSATVEGAAHKGESKLLKGDKGGDTGGCSICAQTGLLFLMLPEGFDRTTVLALRLSIGDEIELIGDQDALNTIRHTGRVNVLLPVELVDLDFSEHAWVAEAEVGVTWREFLRKPDCWRAD